jgi:AmiR/NasT family two-component response regulator
MNGDTDKYIEAGMNAYLCKPLKKMNLDGGWFVK